MNPPSFGSTIRLTPSTCLHNQRAEHAVDCLASLKAFRLRSPHSQTGDPVFPALGPGGSRNGGGTRLSHRNVQRRAWEPIRDALGIPEKVTFHRLRRAFASRAHARGVTLQDLSMVMGHSSTAVTAKVYVHLYGREQAEEWFRQAMARAH